MPRTRRRMSSEDPHGHAALPSPGTRLTAAMAPAFTIGLDRPSGLRSTAATESNAGQ